MNFWSFEYSFLVRPHQSISTPKQYQDFICSTWIHRLDLNQCHWLSSFYLDVMVKIWIVTKDSIRNFDIIETIHYRLPSEIQYTPMENFTENFIYTYYNRKIFFWKVMINHCRKKKKKNVEYPINLPGWFVSTLSRKWLLVLYYTQIYYIFVSSWEIKN